MKAHTIRQHVAVTATAGLLALGQAWAAPAAKGPVKVFILAGQSNMEGHGIISGGKKGTLETLTTDPATAERYKHLLGKDGGWAARDDVWLSYYGTKSPLTIGNSASKGSIGPEIGFGWVVGDYLDEPVLLIKFGPGGTSLAGPWRPPSSGKAPGKDGERDRGPGVGDLYDGMIAGVKKQLADLKTDFPEIGDRGYELAGFGWHQGWNDGCGMADTLAYEKNMINFIKDARKDLGVPNLPFVIGGSGFGGWAQTVDRRLMIQAAQKAAANQPEFKNDTRFVETRGFFRPADQSPNRFGYHWNCNAETHYLVGEGMGQAMVELLGGPKAPANPTGPDEEK
jgi:hypothetical protein